MKQEKNNTSFWDERRGVIRTKKGGIEFGKAVHCHGYSMMDDFVGRISYFQLLILNIIGRIPEKRIAEWCEAFFICNSYPDARIWCNQIGSLAGTMKASPVAASCAGTLASDSRNYGAGVLVAGIDFIVNALRKKQNGMSVDEIVKEHQRGPKSKPIIIGYARPVANGDERVPAMERVTAQLGFETGEHLRLVYEIEDYLFKNYGERMNILAYIAAFFSDQGFSAAEIYRICSAMVLSGVQACYSEANDQAAWSFFPLRCEDVEYLGAEARPVPDL